MVARGVSGIRERMSHEQLPLASLCHGGTYWHRQRESYAFAVG